MNSFLSTSLAYYSFINHVYYYFLARLLRILIRWDKHRHIQVIRVPNPVILATRLPSLINIQLAFLVTPPKRNRHIIPHQTLLIRCTLVNNKLAATLGLVFHQVAHNFQLHQEITHQLYQLLLQ